MKGTSRTDNKVQTTNTNRSANATSVESGHNVLDLMYVQKIAIIILVIKSVLYHELCGRARGRRTNVLACYLLAAINVPLLQSAAFFRHSFNLNAEGSSGRPLEAGYFNVPTYHLVSRGLWPHMACGAGVRPKENGCLSCRTEEYTNIQLTVTVLRVRVHLMYLV